MLAVVAILARVAACNDCTAHAMTSKKEQASPSKPPTLAIMVRPGKELPVSEFIKAYEGMLDAGTLETEIADAFKTIENQTTARSLDTSAVSASKRAPSDVKSAAKPKAGIGSVLFAGAIGHLSLKSTAFDTLDRVFMPP